ncbi:MAG: YqaJ viral recombinase family protein [Candidatus Nanopelagicales bacterium]
MSCPYDILDVRQRTPEWWQARVGRVTSSRCAAIFTSGRKKGEESIQRRDYRLELALGRITGEPAEDMDTYKSPWVERGKALEAEAVAATEAATGVLVATPGFLQHRELLVGTSLDGAMMRPDGLHPVEVKVPKPATHWRYLTDPDVALADYGAQMAMHQWITGHPVLFVSYCPAFPAPLRLHRQVVDQRGQDLEMFEAGVRAFLEDVDADVQRIQERCNAQ